MTMKQSSGFSLVEMLVVLAIIGLILGMMAPKIFAQFTKAQHEAAKSTVKIISNDVFRYYMDVGSLPDRLEDLVEEPSGADGWNGPYMERKNLKDPWNEPFHYEAPGQHGDYDIYSYGADKQQGGEGKNADVTNWGEA